VVPTVSAINAPSTPSADRPWVDINQEGGWFRAPDATAILLDQPCGSATVQRRKACDGWVDGSRSLGSIWLIGRWWDACPVAGDRAGDAAVQASFTSGDVVAPGGVKGGLRMLEACRGCRGWWAVTVMRYEVRVAGRMSELARSAFRGMAVASVAPETIIYSEVADDADLHGLLELCQNLGCRSSPCARH
jgi:hypothetical protein